MIFWNTLGNETLHKRFTFRLVDPMGSLVERISKELQEFFSIPTNPSVLIDKGARHLLHAVTFRRENPGEFHADQFKRIIFLKIFMRQ